MQQAAISSHHDNAIREITLGEASEIWARLLTPDTLMPMFSFAWYETWLNVQPAWKPYILLVNDTTLAPFVRQENTVQFTHAFTDYNDLIGEKKDVWPLIVDHVQADGVTSLHFENVFDASETANFFKYLATTKSTCTLSQAKTAPALTFPTTFADYLKSIKEKRKKYNRFQREYPQANVKKSEQIDKDMDILINLMKLNSIKKASFTPQKEQFFRSITLACQQNVQLLLLSLEETIIAAELMFISYPTAMVYISGYDRDAYPNAGTYLLMESIRIAIEGGYKAFSFLIGKEQYKYELGAHDVFLDTIDCNLET